MRVRHHVLEAVNSFKEGESGQRSAKGTQSLVVPFAGSSTDIAQRHRNVGYAQARGFVGNKQKTKTQ